MTDKRKFNETEFLTEFITVYKSFPCLWKIKSKEYSDKNLKQKGYEALVNVCRTYDEAADVQVVKKKISCLRAAFRREFKKQQGIKHSGVGAEESEEYVPSLWYFNLLLFILDQERPRTTISNDGGNDDNDLRETEEQDKEEELPITKKKKRKSSPNILEKAYQALSKEEDEYDFFGVTVAAKLRKMDPLQRIYCENIINTALFKGSLNQLLHDSTLTSSVLPLPTNSTIFNNSTQSLQSTSTYTSVPPLSSSVQLVPTSTTVSSLPSYPFRSSGDNMSIIDSSTGYTSFSINSLIEEEVHQESFIKL
ncbi:hypothetical protein FQR65_LT09486 [Abscondita terminalis]|nr:hypothetical protein FQR65_LT09486 [Abscondita terminalis]